MNELTFTMWLNGWVELNGGKMPTEAQWEMIKEHLALSFYKVTKPLDETPPIAPIAINPFPKAKDFEFPERSYYPPYVPNYWLDTIGDIPPGTVYC